MRKKVFFAFTASFFYILSFILLSCAATYYHSPSGSTAFGDGIAVCIKQEV